MMLINSDLKGCEELKRDAFNGLRLWIGGNTNPVAWVERSATRDEQRTAPQPRPSQIKAPNPSQGTASNANQGTPSQATSALNTSALNTLRRWIGMDSDSRTFTYTYTYNAQGQLAALDGPRTDVDDRSEFQYDLQGNRIAATNALGQTHQILAHNPQGLPTLMEDANGLQIQLSYNAQGWLLSKTVGQATTTYQYDPVANYDGTGRVTQITAADGSWIQTHYNQGGKVIALQNNLGERQRFQLDRQGNPVQYESVDASNQLTQTFAKQYDALSRLTAQIGAHQQTVRYQYDPNDNLTAQTDALGHVTGYQYDALNRLVTTVDAHQNTALQRYDAMGNLSQVIDPRGIVTHYHYNGFGELLQQQSADTGSTVNQYDANGNRIQSIDARGVLSEMHYDPLNRLTAIDYPESPDQNIAYHYQNGKLAEVEDATGSQHYQYDLNGRITQQQHQIEGQHYQVDYQYNAAGQLLNTTYPSGRVLNYHYDDLGRLSGIEQQHNPEADANIIVDQISYLPFGPRQGLRFGNGIEAQQQRDLDYRISVLSHVADAANDGTDGAVDDAADGNDTAERLHRQYQYDANNNIVAIENVALKNMAIENIVASQSSQKFEYDALNRLTQAEGGYGQLSYDYDAVGNRLSKTTAANGLLETDTYLNTETYQYAETSNRLLAVQQVNGIDLASTRQLSYSANGNIQQDLNAGNARQLIYNARNRLVEITEAGQTVALYGHNTQGQRVIKAVGERGQHFIYNQFDQMIAEANDQGVIEKEYVYLGNTAIAHIESANDAVYYYHSDHLGSAQMITDQTQQVVWAADYSPFGMLELGEGEGAVENNWRFPGQYADGESGYYYNYFRDYDPTLGRYLQSDPIGLGGGFNTFGYVGGNPVGSIDLQGLKALVMQGGIDFNMFGLATTDSIGIAIDLDSFQIHRIRTRPIGGASTNVGANGFVAYSIFNDIDSVFGNSNEYQADIPYLKLPGFWGGSGTVITNDTTPAETEIIGSGLNLELGIGRKGAQSIQTETSKYNPDYWDTGSSCKPL